MMFSVTGPQTDLWGCQGGAARSSGTGRMDQLRRPAAGSAWAAWSRSVAAPPSSRNAAASPSNLCLQPGTGWSPAAHLLLAHLPHHSPGPVWCQSGRVVKGRRAACWCLGRRQPEVWAQRGWGSRRCCLEMFVGRYERVRQCRRCHIQETGSCWGGRSSSATPDWTPEKKMKKH